MAGMMTSPVPLKALRECEKRHSGLELLVPFGSRAFGEAHELSDWDAAFCSDGTLDVNGLPLDLVRLSGCDRVDSLGLRRASGLIRYRVARAGAVVLENHPGAFDRFARSAARFWLEVRPTVESAPDDWPIEGGPYCFVGHLDLEGLTPEDVNGSTPRAYRPQMSDGLPTVRPLG